MNTQIDWREELDSSFGRGVDRAPADYLVPARAALRRRRTAMGAAALATVIVVGGIGWAVAPGDHDVRSSHVANSPTSATSKPTTKGPKTPVSARAVPWPAGDGPARVTPGKGLEIREGAVVHQRRDDLYPGKDTESVALDISFEGTRWWLALEWDKGGSASSSEHAGELNDSFDAFVASSTSGGGMFSPEPDPIADKYPYGRVVNYGLDGVIELRPGATIVRRVDNPHSLTPPETSVGLVVEFEGETIWLSLDSSPTGGGGTFVKEADSGWATFDEWLADQVALQQGEPGLRLVSIDDEGVLTPALPGVEIIEQQSDPDLEAYTGGVATASAAAMLTWDGETWFALVVRFPRGEDTVVSFAADKADGASNVEEFIEFARSRGDGEGLR